jgi:hypothetical protein
MASSKIFNDPIRQKKQLDISSYSGRYNLDVPGNGSSMPIQEDVQLRMQRWGANLRTNPMDIESDLRGLTRPINRDYIGVNDYKTHASVSSSIDYSVATPYIDETRATHPAWMYRETELNRWELPWLNPLANIEKPFHNNINTRILEKDNYNIENSVNSLFKF